jgi:hypothetical protein
MITVLALFAPGVAVAGPVLGIDVEGVYPLGQGLSPDIGYGGTVRLGYKLPIPALALTPEVGVGYHSFRDDGNVIRAVAGGRASFGAGLAAGAYGHVGYARLDLNNGRSSLIYDGGLTLDVTAVPVVDLGVQAGYNRMELDSPVGWLSFGGHATFSF